MSRPGALGGRARVELERLAYELVDILATIVPDSDAAKLLAVRAGFVRERFPEFMNASVFWGFVIGQVLDGRVGQQALVSLVGRALEEHPHHHDLRRCAAALREAVRSVEAEAEVVQRPRVSGTQRSPLRREAAFVGTWLGIVTLASAALVLWPGIQAEAPEGAGTTSSLAPPSPPDADEGLDVPHAVDAGGRSPTSGVVPEPRGSCSDDEDCGEGRRCSRPKPSHEHLGTITKKADRGSHTALLGHACAGGKTRVGTPRVKVAGAGDVECQTRWRNESVQSCEVDVVLLGPQTEEVRCDVYAVLRGARAPRGRCEPA